MRIEFSPINTSRSLTLERLGDTLIINGASLDLSVIPDGATLPAGAVDSIWISGPISRIGGVLHLTIRLPHGYIPFPPPPGSEVVTFPKPITVTNDGPITLPHWAPPDPEPAPETAE